MAVATPTPLILTTAEAGERLKRSDETVRRLIAAGKLRARLIGRRWFVDGESLAELEAQEAGK